MFSGASRKPGMLGKDHIEVQAWKKRRTQMPASARALKNHPSRSGTLEVFGFVILD